MDVPTLVCYQSGENPPGDLQASGFHWLEVRVDNQWVPVERLRLEDDIGWTEEVYIIPMNDKIEWEFNWERLYGELPAGRYRIGKKIVGNRGIEGFKVLTYYACFEILK